MPTVTGPNVNVAVMSFAPLSISRICNDFTLSGELPDAAAKASLLDALKGGLGPMSI
jgi:peptidoglycan-binding protein ArfA